MSINKLILGDNLEILKTIEDSTVDLIYLDPPFFSNRNYEVIWGDAGEVRSFQDRWAGGVDHYITWLKERVAEMHRILKSTGSIFLHCDWHADAYIRVEILDRIFGMNGFRNAIDWCYNVGGKSKNYFARKKDTIFWYTKTNKWIFNGDKVGIKRDTGTKSQGGKIGIDENGRSYQDKIVRKTGKIYRYYLDENKIPEDWWTDINSIQSGSKERIGYPTQKPEALLQRIIECASNEGDLILDPFVGGGTTVAVADRLNRRWIGVDQSAMAVKVSELRLDKQRDLFSAPFTVQLHKYDYDTLRYKNAFAFESWIIQQFGGLSNTKQRGDFGLDGRMPDGTPIQVKRSDNVGRNVIDNFKSAVERYDKKLFDKNVAAGKPAGYIIAFSFGRGAVEEVARLKLKENIIIRLVTVEETVPIAKKPVLRVEVSELDRDAKGVREIEFIAASTSEVGIEFYSWDFDYDLEKGFRASVIIDKEGRQRRKLKAGVHHVAVKVVDNDGLENTEILKL
ncbi:MAG: hypothetical protein LBF90_02695, partial [Prevotellaceae bacterium]|nr:hypothetical protein [Prevotellaceae bacterium]